MTIALLACLVVAQGLTPEVIEHAQAGTRAMKQGRFDQAIQEFLRVTAAQPESASGHANLGEAYFQNRDFAAAIPELQLALQLNPQMMGTHQTLGVALLVEGNAEEAIPHLEKIRTPELLGLAYLETGRLGNAIMALRAALEHQPDDPDLLYYFGRATDLAAKQTFDQLKKMGPDVALQRPAPAKGGLDPVQEVVRLEMALAQSPDDPRLLAEFHEEAGVASAQAFDKISKGSARAHQVAAERLAASSRFEEAEREYAEAIRLKPYTPELHLELGNILAADGKLAGAIEQFRDEAAVRPLSVETWYHLGYALLKQGQARDAQAAFSRADQLRPNTPQTLLALGQASFDARDVSHAEQAWTKLIEIDHSSELAAQAHFRLAALYRDAGKSPEAQREMDAYQQLKNQRVH